MAKIEVGKRVKLGEEAHESLELIEKTVFYVQPHYNELHKDNAAKFVIFSAPGASGKSVLAKYIANRYCGLYWDLAKITLGENSFHGTLFRALQPEQFQAFFEDIKSGKAILVLDAFDEAEMISGRLGIEHLLKDLDDTTKGSIEATIFLFARTESAMFIADYCEKNEIHYSQYEIGFFEEYNAKEFIKKKLEYEGKTITPTVTACIDEQFAVINRLLGDTEVSKTFLGYAPVLEALSKAFDEERNTVKLLESIKGRDITSTDIIFKILEYLTKREQDKLCNALREKWITRFPEFQEWDSLYSVEEQMVRVVEYITWGKIEEESFYQNGGLSNELYCDYMESVKGILPQHPFLQYTAGNAGGEFTGPAFRDYALAYLLAHREYEDLAIDYYSDRSLSTHFPSQLLFDFYTIFSRKKMTGKIFPLLYDSFKSKETSSKTAVIDVNGVRDDVTAEFRLIDSSGYGNEQSVELQLEGEEPLYISRIANANIDIDKEIVIGDSKNVTRLYNSMICCEKAIFNTCNILIEAREPNGCLLFSVQEAENRYSDTPKFEIRADRDELVRINMPNINMFYRLRAFKYELEQLDEEDYFRFSLFVKKIMNCMRKHGKDVPAKDKEFIDNEIISKNERKKKYMSFLQEKSIIFIDKEEPYLYKLDVKRLGEHGINWAMLSTSMEGGLKRLYQEYIADGR